MRQPLSFLALGLVLGCLLTTAGFVTLLRHARAGGGGEGVSGFTVLRIAHGLDQNHPVHAAIVDFASRVETLSGGELIVRVFPNGQLGSEPECVEQVQRGALAMAKTSAGPMEGFVPEMAAFSVPYLFRDEDHFWRVLDGPVGRELLLAGEAAGLLGLCYYDAGARSFYTVSRPILTPADARGLKIRVQSSRLARDLVSSLGAGPMPVPWGELYTALQQSMVDGAENNPPSFISSRHHEVARHFSLNEHTRVPDIVVFSKRIWEALPPRHHAWLMEAAADSVRFQREL